MPGRIVIDASVAVKWFIWEDHSRQAAALLEDCFAEGIRLIGPELLPFEVANAIYWQQRRELITVQEADKAIVDYTGRGIEIVPSEYLVPVAVDFARTHNLLAVYDAVYVVLARELGADLWTDDQRLLNSLGDAAPWVRWIGDWAPEQAEGSRQ